MKKIQFKKEIAASAEKVYETMLGLKDKNTYRHWTSAFNPRANALKLKNHIVINNFTGLLDCCLKKDDVC